MTDLLIEGGRSLKGELTAPPDKSITHRALFLSALGEGETIIAPLGGGRDNRATVSALRALGVSIELQRDGARALSASIEPQGDRVYGAEIEARGDTARVLGVGGPLGLRAPEGPIDCMNSGTTMRVLSGILAASRIKATLIGDESLSQRPMSRLQPLTEMGAKIGGRLENGKLYPPITIEGALLEGREHVLKVASAQVKTALILAGLWSRGPSVILEPMRSRDHTERMLARLGAPIAHRESDQAILVEPITTPWRARHLEVAPDLSSASFFLGAALTTQSSELKVITGVNPTRAGVLEVLEAMQASMVREPLADRSGEPVAKLTVSASALRATKIEGALTLRAIDEIPLLAGLALFAEGTTEIRDAGELRVKESDRLKATRAMLEAFGGRVEETADGLTIHGGAALHAAEVDSAGDHRIAMTAAVIALGVRGTTRIRGAEHIEVSFPAFVPSLESLGAAIQRPLR